MTHAMPPNNITEMTLAGARRCSPNGWPARQSRKTEKAEAMNAAYGERRPAS